MADRRRSRVKTRLVQFYAGAVQYGVVSQGGEFHGPYSANKAVLELARLRMVARCSAAYTLVEYREMRTTKGPLPLIPRWSSLSVEVPMGSPKQAAATLKRSQAARVITMG